MKLLQISLLIALSIFSLFSSHAIEISDTNAASTFITISDKRVKDFFKKHNLDITSLWQQAEDSLSAKEVAQCEIVIPQAILKVSDTIAKTIALIMAKATQEDIERLLGHSYDLTKSYQMESINFITVLIPESEIQTLELFVCHQISAINFQQFKKNLAHVIASHFLPSSLNARLEIADNTLLSEPLCALIIDETENPNFVLQKFLLNLQETTRKKYYKSIV